MKNKIISIILAFVLALLTTILSRASIIVMFLLFVLFIALVDSIGNLLNKKNINESKQLISISICGIACLISLTTILNTNSYKIISYTIFYTGFLGMLLSLMFFTPPNAK